MEFKYKKAIYFSGILFLSLLVSTGKTQALTYSQIIGQGKVLGVSTAAYPYVSGSLVNDSGTIYFISGTTKVPFTNWQAFVGLGYSLKNVAKGNLANYSLSTSYAISTSNTAHPWGGWLSYNGTVYYSTSQGLIGVPSAAVFAENGGAWNLVVKANKYDIANLGSALAVLANNDPRVLSGAGGNSALSFGVPSPAPTPGGSQNSVPNAPSTGSNVSSGTFSTNPGQLNTPTLSTISPAGQFMAGGSNNQNIAVYNFTASGSPVTIQELDFTVTDSTAMPITWITAGGLSGQASTGLGATSSVTDLNITVPGGAVGLNVPVSVNLASIDSVYMPSNQTFALNLVGVKYTSAGESFYLNANASSNTMDLVSSYPIVSIVPAGQTLTDGTVEIAKITVAANHSNSIILNQLPITITSAGNAAIAGTSSNVTVLDDSGIDVQINPITFSLSASGTASAVITLNSDNLIAANTSKTYDIYMTVQGAVGASAGPSALLTSLAPGGSFMFSDPAGGGNSISGSTYILNYPNNSVSAHN